ncbi:hypothetical protein QLL95_gp0048 [Cotonvirus japonicus]|uniref:Uncharacterized protein n=1 Tax=Cotonvirus japonicus TaxID=2811091 RepID=A0ABM7NQZ2_9VIRU|nr:hypothetical protein QLL95_gp0048 [Cotonvirus japonicus]BCS82537.1 hypothetical protein [Cotonvirus japonicus]
MHKGIYYWIGPYGIRIPANIKFVLAEDGFNYMYENGWITDMFVNVWEMYSLEHQMNEKIYKTKYATYNSKDKHWYYQQIF